MSDFQPRYVRVNPLDNVGIVVNAGGVSAGAEFPGGIVLREPIPQAHKLALRPIAQGEAVLRYGQPIGVALRSFDTGDYVREIGPLEAPALDSLSIATAVPPSLPPLEGFTFAGFRNPDGSVGTRNILGITTTVQCVAPTVDFAVRRIRQEILPQFPNVDDVCSITHTYGCGVAIDAPDAAIPIRTLQHISEHANIGGSPLVISLGCEKLQPARLFAGSEFPVLDNVIRMQDEPGFAAMVAAIMRAAEKRLEILNKRQRVSCPASELIVGLQCGGSDAFSGVTCNPAVGFLADLLVRAGATVMFSEVSEVRDAVHLLTPRAMNHEVGIALIREMRWYDEYLARGHADRSANTTPGNKRGGLSNIIEKSLGSIAKAGSTALQAVASHGEKVGRGKGLVFAATPASDFICGTQQLASMNMHVFTTGEGSPYGLSLVPVIKVSSRTALAEKWPDLIDFDAGGIAAGVFTIEQAGWKLFEQMLTVASGKKTWSEQWGLGNALAPFNPGPVT